MLIWFNLQLIGDLHSVLSVHTKNLMLYPVNPCSFMMIHGNELHQITGAPHCINPSLIKLFGVCLYMGRIYALLVVKVSMHMLGNPWFFVIYIWEWITSNSPNYRGTSWRKSFLNNLLDVCLYMGRIYAFLVKYQSDGVLLFNGKYVNDSHVYKL